MLFEAIKRWWNKRTLKTQPKPIKRTPVGFDDAKKIGVLVNSCCEESIRAVQKLVTQLRSTGKQVEVFGVNSAKYVIHSKMKVPFLGKPDVNWAGVPQKEKVQQFLNTSFDVLLVANPVSTLTLEYLSTLSNARLKVGPVTADTKSYDLMLDVSKNYNMVAFVEQLVLYARLVNPAPKPVLAMAA